MFCGWFWTWCAGCQTGRGTKRPGAERSISCVPGPDSFWTGRAVRAAPSKVAAAALAAAMGAMAILSGCAAMMDSAVTELPCGAFEPINWSIRDTDATILAIKQHNAAWLAVCAK